jgi:hypothetical protein
MSARKECFNYDPTSKKLLLACGQNQATTLQNIATLPFEQRRPNKRDQGQNRRISNEDRLATTRP